MRNKSNETHTATEENYGVYKDYLGSIELIVDQVIGSHRRASFDAWEGIETHKLGK